MNKYYFSKNYKDLNSAGNKAKTDIERIMSEIGYINAGMALACYKNSIVGFFYTLFSVLKVLYRVSKNDLLVIQYPLKKYYRFVTKIACWKGCYVITVIHDLGSFRRKKLTVEGEINKLSNSDYLIVHNNSMKSWLQEKGFRKPMGVLNIFDYLSETEATDKKNGFDNFVKIVYAGGLSYKKNRFIYEVDKFSHHWIFSLYGGGFEQDRVSDSSKFDYKGFVSSDDLIRKVDGHFGLIWDGEAIDTCSGAFGDYLRYNNPHKTSLYIRCHLPVIVWKEAAIASVVNEYGIGICVENMKDIDQLLSAITQQEYDAMVRNTVQLSKKLSTGYFIKKALSDAEVVLGA